MDDRESDLDLEFAELLNQERKKEPYILESVEVERKALVMAFYDHYTSLTEFQEFGTVEDVLALMQQMTSERKASSYNDAEAAKLMGILKDLIVLDLRRYPIMLQGEMSVMGEGIYSPIEKEVDNPSVEEAAEVGDVEILEAGMRLSGDITTYSIGSLISYQTFLHTQESDDLTVPGYDDDAPEMVSLLLVMSDVTVYSESGEKVTTHDTVVVPLEYPSLKFDKIIRQSDAMLPPDAEVVHLPAMTHFKSDFMLDFYTDAENDLNFNDYDEIELGHHLEGYQQDLDAYMGIVDVEEGLTLSILSGIMLDGSEKEFTACKAYYLNPTIIKIHEAWRIVHAFQIMTEEGSSIVHVLPENLIDIKGEYER